MLNSVLNGDWSNSVPRKKIPEGFQCRTNTLRLKWRQGFVGGAVDCPLCGAVEETVAHFVTECVVLEGVREQFGDWNNPGGGVGGDTALQRVDT